MTTAIEALKLTTSRQFTKLSLLRGTSENRGDLNHEMRSFWTKSTSASLMFLIFSHQALADVMAFGSGANRSAWDLSRLVIRDTRTRVLRVDTAFFRTIFKVPSEAKHKRFNCS